MMAMRISRAGLSLIKEFEGFVPFVYDDLVRVNGRYTEYKGGKVIGTLTIGYGHTKAAKGQYPMGLGSRITEARATQLLDEDLDPVEDFVNRVVKVPITQGQFDALVSITYNMGEGNLAKSLLLARLNARDYDGARAAFGLYVNSKGRRLNGLVRRRAAEQRLWDTPDTSKVKVSEITPVRKDEVVVTPKEVDQPVRPNAVNTVEGSSGLATSGLGGSGVVNEANSALDKASEYADKVGDIAQTADALGVQPLTLAALIGPKAAAFFGFLFGSTLFWISLAVVVLGLLIFFARRWKSRQEVVPGAFHMAGTPLPELVRDDSGYAGVDTSDDYDTPYYRVDPEYMDLEETAVDIYEEPPQTKKRRAAPKKRSRK